MADDYFDAKLALSPQNAPVPGAVAQVFAASDTGFTTPLTITDVNDTVPRTTLTASANGIYPPFRVLSDVQRVVAKSGSSVTPMQSAVGSKGEQGIPGVASVVVVTGLEVRPSAPVVIWIGGTAQPEGMAEGDVWFQVGPTVPTAPSILTATLNTLTAGSPFTQQLTAAGTTPMTWAVTAGALPTGVSLSAGGVLSGTPTTAGAYTFTVTAANSQGTDSRGFTGTVTSTVVAPTITTTSLAALTQGAPFSQQLAATGTAPISYTVTTGTLPAGLSLSSAGLLSGTPTASGVYSFTVTATNSAGSDTQAYSGTVTNSAVAPTITTTTLNSLSVGSAFAQTLAATGTTPLTWSVTAGTLPTGLTLNASTGVLSGTPTTAGAYSFTVTATNSAGSDPQAYSGTIAASAVAPVVTTTTLNALQVGVPFSQTLAATGSTPLTWGVSAGALPAGLGINSSTGTISGTPTTAGAYTFTVQATNSAGSDTQGYTGSVAAAPPATPKNIFGTSAPGSSSTAYNDGGGSIRTAAAFYATKAIRVLGVRVWNPSGADSGFLTAALTAYAYGGDWTGSVTTNPTWGSPVQSKASSGTRTAGTWTDILFDAPITLNAIAAAANSPDYVILAVQYAGGNHYVTTTGVSADAVVSTAESGVYLAESIFRRGYHSLGSGTPNETFYGLDMIFEVV